MDLTDYFNVPENRGSSEGSVNSFRHCRVATEEDNSQIAEIAERFIVSQIAQKAQKELPHTDLMDLTDYFNVPQNRGSSEGSVNSFRHCRVATEEDNSQIAEIAERFIVSQIAQKAQKELPHTDLMDLTDYFNVPQNRGSSESSVNSFRHCRVVTEEDNSQIAERAEML